MEAYTLVRCFDNNIGEQAAIRCGKEMKGTDSGSLVRLMKALSKLGQDDAQLFGSIAQELHERGVHLLSNQVILPLHLPQHPVYAFWAEQLASPLGSLVRSAAARFSIIW